jgi:3-hydroxyisobutyrate dehydrogenase
MAARASEEPPAGHGRRAGGLSEVRACPGRHAGMMPVSVIGLGAMGSRVARRLLGAGYPVRVWNRSPAKTTALARLGAVVAASPAEAAARAEALITMISGPEALQAVTEGADGIAAGAHRSLTVIEMSTTGPAAITRLAADLPAGTGLLDAPVLGSLPEAEAGSLTIFAGGPAARLDMVRPLLSALGTVVPAGPLGCGAAAKLVANMALFSTLAGLGEAITFGRALDLHPDVLADVLAVTPLAAQAARRRQAMETGDYPRRFALSLARKDADLISQAAASAGIELRLADAARAWLAAAEAAGWGGHDYTAVLGAILGRQHQARDPAADGAGRRPRSYDGLIVDLDGVVWLGSKPVSGAAQAIARLRASGTQVVFLTNDPQATREEQAARLTAMSIPATAADVITSAYAAARYLAARRDLDGRAALVCGSPALREEIARAGIRLLPRGKARRAGLVVIGGHERFGYAELRAATIAIGCGAALFATGRDPVVPSSYGPLPATGAVLAAVETATGVTATVIGKPEPYIFGIARRSLAGCRHIAVVGDNLASDIAGARRAGLDAFLVLTGTSTGQDLSRSAVQPDRVFPSLAALGTELCAGRAGSAGKAMKSRRRRPDDMSAGTGDQGDSP